MLTGTGKWPNRYRTLMIPVLVVWAILCPAMGWSMDHPPGYMGVITEGNSTGETRTESIRQADSLFDRLHYAEAAVMYRSLLQGYTRTDSLSCSLINRLAECLWWQLECDQAERLIRESIPEAISILGEHHTETGKLYLNLGIVSFLTMRSGMTEEYMEQSLEIFVNRYGEDHPLTALACEWLGTAHESRNDSVIARQYLTRAWKIREHTANTLQRTGISHKQLLPETLATGNLSRYLGLFYKRFARHDSAVFWFNRALRIFDAAYGPDNVQSVKCLINLCDIYQEANRPDTTLALFNEALKRTGEASGEFRMARFMTLFNLSEFMDYQGKTTQALEYMNQTIAMYDTTYTGIPLTANPVVLPPNADHYLKLSFVWKARYLMALYQEASGKEERLGYLMSALQCDRLIDQINNRIREHIFNYENLLAYEQALVAIYFSMIQRALEAWDVTGDPNYFALALSYIETNRNLQLSRLTDHDRRALASGESRTSGRDASSTVQRFQATINALNDKLVKLEDPGARWLLQREIRKQKITLDQAYYTRYRTHPRKSDAAPLSPDAVLPELRKALDPHTMILEIVELFPDYQSVPNQFLLMAVTPEAMDYRLVAGDSLFSLLMDFSRMVADPASFPDSLMEAGRRIRHLVIDPFDGIREQRDHMVIIPSPHTWLIPFDALPGYSDPAISGIPYLIADLTISREFSLVSWLHSEQHPTEWNAPKHDGVLAIAPRFHATLKQELAMMTKRDTSLIDLPGSRVEVESIHAMFPGTMVAGYEATKELFDTLAPIFPLIHLSTHGIPARGDPGVLMLAFNTSAGDTLHHGFLSMYEILNMRLNSELIVLSACKSAIGIPNKSEGNLNLAWAFRQAGVRSAVVSLWDVNDYASSRIMPLFYGELADGLSKPDALRRAKLQFMYTHDARFSHPFYWAPFDYIGNDTPISTTAIPFTLIFVNGIGILLTLIFFVFFSKKPTGRI